MSIRFCASYVIYLTLTEELRTSYHCRIVFGRCRRVVSVNAPEFCERAIDSSVAFDQAAHAAMSFFSEEDGFDESLAEPATSGWAIRRRRRGPVMLPERP